MYDPALGRFHTVDPLSERYYTQSPYQYVMNNPISFIDPDGTSTHTDSSGVVVAVYDDDDNSVYKHITLPESYSQDDAGLKYKTVTDKDGNEKKVATNKLSGGENMGETEHWDEFISPEGGVLTSHRIQFGKSFDPIIEKYAKIADGMNLIEIAQESKGGGLFDIKQKYKNTGGLLNGKYVTARSAGNYLAGYNAVNSSYLGGAINYQTFQKIAGALHVQESQGLQLSKKQMIGIVVKGTTYGLAPYYGENYYQYRMSRAGASAPRRRNAWYE